MSTIYRYLSIIRQIRTKPYSSQEDIRQMLMTDIDSPVGCDGKGTSPSTFNRDKNAIENLFGLRMKYSKAKNGYYFPEDEVIHPDIERILSDLELYSMFSVTENIKEIVFAERRKSKGVEYIHNLIHSITNNYIVEFAYVKFDNMGSQVRTVEPYALKEFKGRWYLLAMEIGGRLEEIGEIKTWSLDRMLNVNVTKKKFSKNRELNIPDEFKHSFGIYSDKDKPVEEVILSFPPMGGQYNAAFPLHESQETILENEQEFRIKLRVRITYDFIMELLSQTQDMTVVAPQHLKNELIEIYKQAIARITTNNKTEYYG